MDNIQSHEKQADKLTRLSRQTVHTLLNNLSAYLSLLSLSIPPTHLPNNPDGLGRGAHQRPARRHRVGHRVAGLAAADFARRLRGRGLSSFRRESPTVGTWHMRQDTWPSYSGRLALGTQMVG